MAVKDIFKVSRKTFFDPAAWLGVKELKAYNRVIIDTIKETYQVPKPTAFKETFEESMKRQNLTEEDVNETAGRFELFKYIFYTLSVLSGLSSFYFLFHFHTFAGFILALAVSSVFLSQAFRFSFWLYQIKKRRLGCTFQDWWQGK